MHYTSNATDTSHHPTHNHHHHHHHHHITGTVQGVVYRQIHTTPSKYSSQQPTTTPPHHPTCSVQWSQCCTIEKHSGGIVFDAAGTHAEPVACDWPTHTSTAGCSEGEWVFFVCMGVFCVGMSGCVFCLYGGGGLGIRGERVCVSGRRGVVRQVYTMCVCRPCMCVYAYCVCTNNTLHHVSYNNTDVQPTHQLPPHPTYPPPQNKHRALMSWSTLDSRSSTPL